MGGGRGRLLCRLSATQHCHLCPPTCLVYRFSPSPLNLLPPPKPHPPSDEDYAVTTRGRLTDRIRTALAGSVAVEAVLGEPTNFAIPDIRRAHRMAEKMVFFYGGCCLG
jgi:hypothetical protein